MKRNAQQTLFATTSDASRDVEKWSNNKLSVFDDAYAAGLFDYKKPGIASRRGQVDRAREPTNHFLRAQGNPGRRRFGYVPRGTARQSNRERSKEDDFHLRVSCNIRARPIII